MRTNITVLTLEIIFFFSLLFPIPATAFDFDSLILNKSDLLRLLPDPNYKIEEQIRLPKLKGQYALRATSPNWLWKKTPGDQEKILAAELPEIFEVSRQMISFTPPGGRGQDLDLVWVHSNDDEFLGLMMSQEANFASGWGWNLTGLDPVPDNEFTREGGVMSIKDERKFYGFSTDEEEGKSIDEGGNPGGNTLKFYLIWMDPDNGLNSSRYALRLKGAMRRYAMNDLVLNIHKTTVMKRLSLGNMDTLSASLNKSDLPKGILQSLLAKLNAFQLKIKKGDYPPMKGILGSLKNELAALKGKKISEIQFQEWSDIVKGMEKWSLMLENPGF